MLSLNAILPVVGDSDKYTRRLARLLDSLPREDAGLILERALTACQNLTRHLSNEYTRLTTPMRCRARAEKGPVSQSGCSLATVECGLCACVFAKEHGKPTLPFCTVCKQQPPLCDSCYAQVLTAADPTRQVCPWCKTRLHTFYVPLRDRQQSP